VGAGQANGLELYSVVFNAPTEERRFVDSAQLLEWGFRHYRTIELINTEQKVADVALLSWIDKAVSAYVPTAVRIEFFDLRGPITQEIIIDDIGGEATKGRVCGQIIWSQGGEVLMTSEVIIDETVLAPSFWEGIGIAWQRFWGGFNGKPAHEKTDIRLKSELIIPDLPQKPQT
jgi:D-alanyl-D-alanine carboxypeptidase